MKQAGHAVTMFYRMQYHPAPFSGAALAENSLQAAVHNESTPLAAAPAETMATGGKPLKAANQGNSVSPHENDITARTDTQTGSSWVLVYETLNSEIKIRHYSPKTLKSYLSWIRHFQAFTKSKNYQSLTQRDVVDFLSHLAVVKQVSASSQNQAFNALLFLYKQVLKKEFGEIKGSPERNADLTFLWYCPGRKSI